MKIDIISGFLGAGKTTLIKRIIELNDNNKEKIAIIENEFGEVSIDGNILKSSGVEVKEISSGCICCSVAGDFKKGIEEIISSYKPDRLIIEPTGVAKLSQVKSSIYEITDLGAEIRLITVIDPENFNMYIENFGEFYRDQIKNAEIIFISKAETFSKEELDHIKKAIIDINNNAKIINIPVYEIQESDLIPEIAGADFQSKKTRLKKGVRILKAEVVKEKSIEFESITIKTDDIYDKDTVGEIMDRLESMKEGADILRAKGILRAEGGKVIHFEYLPRTKNIEMIENEYYGSEIGNAVIIGLNLDKKKITDLF